MSTYGCRISELRDLLAQAPAPANDRINQNLADGINKYADLRQRALDDLVDFMARASSSNLGTQTKWQSRIARLRSDYNGLFGDSVRDLMLPAAHQLFWSSALQAEERFFDTLSRVGTPQLLDDLLKHQDDLSKLIGALQDTWTFLLSKNQGIQNDEMRAIQAMDQMVQEVISEMDSSGRAVVDNAGRAVDAMRRKAEALKEKIKDGLGRAAGAVDVVIEIFKKLITDEIKPDGFPDEAEGPMEAVLKDMELRFQALAERMRIYRTLLATYKDLLNVQKGSVLTVFNKTREDINRYLDTNNVSRARVWLDQARGQLNDWASALPTPRQRDDGAIFRDDIYKQLDSTWKITQDLDGQFRGKFQGAFLSSISSETVETLAGSYLFREQMGKIKDRDAARKLDEYREKLIEGLNRMEEGSRSMDDPIETLPDEVRELAKVRNKDFKEYVHDRIKRQMESLLPSIDELKRMVTPSNFDADFNRQELEGMLR
jgi:molecular chaperone GrpE (heat shock protein)